ncbi:MAG: RNA polymerase sigma factor [Candidatus Eremiobacteraeota bacterium]|nr:RNA polymerase sigma factor [Candidatus Eremiobacteraeota bacterium]
MLTPIPIEVIEAAKDGGSAQIELLVETAWPDAYRLALAIVGERQRAEDAAQEACIILYRTISSLRTPAAFRSWFYRIVVREASEIKRRGIRTEPASQSIVPTADETASIDIWRALSALPHNLRTVVVLAYFEDLKSREIASILRIPDATVRFRLMIAKRRLRPLLGNAYEPATHPVNEVRTNAI